MTSTSPGGAGIPGPKGLPPEEQPNHQQPDPFGEPTDEEGAPLAGDTEDVGDLPSKDPRGE